MVALDRQQIVCAFLEKDLLAGFILSVHGIGDHDLLQQLLTFQ